MLTRRGDAPLAERAAQQWQWQRQSGPNNIYMHIHRPGPRASPHGFPPVTCYLVPSIYMCRALPYVLVVSCRVCSGRFRLLLLLLLHMYNNIIYSITYLILNINNTTISPSHRQPTTATEEPSTGLYFWDVPPPVFHLYPACISPYPRLVSRESLYLYRFYIYMCIIHLLQQIHCIPPYD